MHDGSWRMNSEFFAVALWDNLSCLQNGGHTEEWTVSEQYSLALVL